MKAKNVAEPNIVVAAAFGYGGLVQLAAGMWYVLSKAAVTQSKQRNLTSNLQGNGCR
jgi:succinate-acetate transporter protein